jgi:hypothetical protein
MDGLGLVYEKQGNTGAAAYNQPVFQIGNNPLDMLAAEIGQQGRIEQINQMRQQKELERGNQQALKFDASGWDIDNKAFFTQATKDLMAEGAYLQSQGYNLNDWSNPEVRKWNENKIGTIHAAQASKGQEKEIKAYLDNVTLNPDKFDVDATMKNFRAYQAMTPIQRMQLNPADIVVPMEKPLDIYTPLEEIKIDDFVDVSDSENPETRFKTNKLRDKDLKTAIAAQIKNPIYQDIIKKGVEKGLFKDEAEYAQMLFDKKKLEFSKNTTYEKKSPPSNNEWSLDYINSRSSDDLMGEIGYGATTIKLYKGGTHNYAYTTDVGNINAVIGKRGAIDASDGKYLNETGTLNLQSGKLVLAPVDAVTGIPIHTKNPENERKLLKEGKIIFKPMIIGKASEGTGDTKKEIDIWVPAESTLQTTGESKTMTAAQKAYIAYQKKANDLNSVREKKTTGTQNTQPKKTATRAQVKSLVGTKGYEGYTEQELIEYYKRQGYEIK